MVDVVEEEERGRSAGEVGWKACEPPNVARAATRVVVVDEEDLIVRLLATQRC